MNNLILIIGTGRSGTTLLSEILEASNEIQHFEGEKNKLWHPKLYPYKGYPFFQSNPIFFTVLSILKWSFWDKLKINLTIIKIKLILKLKKKNFLIKSPMLTFLIPLFLEKFKNIKILNIERNSLNVVESWVRKEFKEKYSDNLSEDEYRKILLNYVSFNEKYFSSDTFLKLRNKKYLKINYEDLVHDNKNTLNKIKIFCNLNNDLTVPEKIIIDKNR